MATRQELFWSRVWSERRHLTDQLKTNTHPGQPTWSESQFAENFDFPNKGYDSNSVYLTSQQNYDKGTKGGTILLASVHLAGQRIAESTHRLSTESEIVEYKKIQAEKYDAERKKMHITAAGAAAAAMATAQEQYNQIPPNRPAPGKPTDK